MLPAFLADFEHFFYANLDNPVSDGDFSDWVLSVFDNAGNEVAANVGTLQQDVISGSDFRFYAFFTIPGTVPQGTYQLVVYNSMTLELKYQSNCFDLIYQTRVEEYVYLQYRNSSDLYNYGYENVPEYNTIFIPWNLVEQQPEIELDQYVEQTTGRRRNLKTISSKVLTVEAYFFDDDANNMMLALSVHDDILINGKVVEVKSAYTIEPNRINSLQKGTIEFYDQDFSTINLNG